MLFLRQDITILAVHENFHIFVQESEGSFKDYDATHKMKATFTDNQAHQQQSLSKQPSYVDAVTGNKSISQSVDSHSAEDSNQPMSRTKAPPGDRSIEDKAGASRHKSPVVRPGSSSSSKPAKNASQPPPSGEVASPQSKCEATSPTATGALNGNTGSGDASPHGSQRSNQPFLSRFVGKKQQQQQQQQHSRNSNHKRRKSVNNNQHNSRSHTLSPHQHPRSSHSQTNVHANSSSSNKSSSAR